jgi:hypothetical protein
MSRLELITQALRGSFSASQLAAAGDVCLASAKNYRAGKGLPNMVVMARLMRQSPGLLAAFIEYVGLDDASLERETARLTRLLAELHEQKAAADARLDQVSPAADRHEPADRRMAGAQAQGAVR